MFKHLVISGGGSLTIKILGTIQYMLENSVITYDEIESIYATSAGALIGIGVALKMDIQLLTNYVINRPWEDMCQISPSHVYNLYSNKGIFDKTCITKFMQPLLDFKNIDINITLFEFFTLTNIDLHMFAVELDNISIVDISHKTFPELSLIDALCMTSCLPIVFEPIFYKDAFYIDAGIILNYPLEYCIKNVEDETTILGFEIIENKKYDKIEKNSDLVNYSFILLCKLFKKAININKCEIPNTIKYFTDEDIFSSLMDSFSSEKRQSYIDEGFEYGEKFVFKQ
uniref:PNPLA domain-containing protein n=1 Tax=viral metagenome TaxID=1070528 RepID=A0A6C0HSL1_9ZZZZ